MKKKSKLSALILLVVVGSAIIFWFDALCEYARIHFGTNSIFIITTIIILISGLIWGNKIIKFIKGQLGG